ncbi:MAG: hypothetical protein IKN24_02920 [Lachnospiraceae bacterium]|nr:hypothetical protein [Lachnospiraceae bacterium]
MSRELSEKKVLKKLGIDDFTQMTKNQIIDLAGMMDRMSPEVAQKAMEQFPEFSNASREMLLDYKDSLDKTIASNDKSMESFYKNCTTIIDSLQKELDNDKLTFKEKKYIIEQMKDIADMMDRKDSENKVLLTSLASFATIAVSAAVLGVTALIGTGAGVKKLTDDLK